MNNREAVIVVDLSFGDAGKGSMVDYLTRKLEAHTIIRFNGGSQAAHNVVTKDGKHHTFSQFGSGTFVPGVRTYLSRFTLVNPIALMEEGEKLIKIGIKDAILRMDVDKRALVTTPFHWAANRLKEMARGDARHGSCGKGIGETMADWLQFGDEMLFVGDLRDKKICLEKLLFHQKIKKEQLKTVIDKLPKTRAVIKELDIILSEDVADLAMKFYKTFTNSVNIVNENYLQNILQKPGNIIFEGAQGALIDEWYGFHPYTTWSTTTAKNALNLLKGYTGKITKLGLLRAYATRHGAGPFMTEIEQLGNMIPDIHNDNNKWQEKFRVGWLDLVATRYAIAINEGIDCLAVTNLDRFEQLDEWKIADGYHFPGEVKEKTAKYFNFCEDDEFASGIKVKPDMEDLDYQTGLTELLQKSKARYIKLPEDCSVGLKNSDSQRTIKYLRFLESRLQTPIAFISRGVTAEDKFELLSEEI